MTHSPVRLLYIEDDPGVRALVQRGLTSADWSVELASDGGAGAARVAQGGIDAVALDQFMPGLDGLETLALIRAMPDPPPVVLVTGSQDSALAVAALKAGAADYVVKDGGADFLALLRVAVEGAIEAAKLRRAKEAADAEIRAARDRFEALAAERGVLLREVNHRVGNSLQLIAALLQLQSGTSASADVKAALATAVSRVMAVAQVHKRLYTSDSVQSVAVDLYLESLVEDLRRSSDEGKESMLTLEAQSLEIDPDRAVALGVIVNELVINALKYAYPSGTGPIRIALQQVTPEHALLSVEDDGIGEGAETGEDSDARRRSTGLGQQIVSAMAVKLGASVARDEGHSGTRVLVAFDPRRVVREPSALGA